MSRIISVDAQQQAYAYLVGQLQHLEPQAYRRPYPNIRYPTLVPVDTSANAFAQGVTYISAEGYGTAEFVGRGGEDFPVVSTSRDKHSVLVDTLGSSYEYDMFELEAARLMNQDLSVENVALVRRVMEERIDKIVFSGESSLSWDPLWKKTGIDILTLGNGAAGTATWATKTPQEIIRDVNRIHGHVYEGSKQAFRVNTLLIPPSAYSYIVGTTISDASSTTILEFIKNANILSAETGEELVIRGIHGFENAGPAKVGRAMAYWRDDSVLKLHLPMATRFLPLFQKTPTTWQHAAIFRTGGLEIRMPTAMVYADGLTA